MQTDRALAFDESRVDLACFEVADHRYALEVGQVVEIVRCSEITPLPKAPALIEGVIDLRGVVIPVLDLGCVLGGEPVPDDDPRARIVVVAADGFVLGLRVGAAVDVLALPARALEDPPALAMHAGYDAVRAVVRSEKAGGAPILVLSLDHVLECVYRSSAADANARRTSPSGELA